MQKNFALIVAGRVANVIVADDAFVAAHPELTLVELPYRPQVGDSYDAATKTFMPAVQDPPA